MFERTYKFQVSENNRKVTYGQVKILLNGQWEVFLKNRKWTAVQWKYFRSICKEMTRKEIAEHLGMESLQHVTNRRTQLRNLRFNVWVLWASPRNNIFSSYCQRIVRKLTNQQPISKRG